MFISLRCTIDQVLTKNPGLCILAAHLIKFGEKINVYESSLHIWSSFDKKSMFMSLHYTFDQVLTKKSMFMSLNCTFDQVSTENPSLWEFTAHLIKFWQKNHVYDSRFKISRFKISRFQEFFFEHYDAQGPQLTPRREKCVDTSQQKYNHLYNTKH